VDGAYAQFTEARQLHEANDMIDEYEIIDINEFEEARKMVRVLMKYVTLPL
jgi:hypothetical protein